MNLLTLKLIALLAIPMYLLTTASEGSDENEPKHLPGDLESYLDIDPPETRSGRSHKEEPQHLRGDLEAHLDIDPPETRSGRSHKEEPQHLRGDLESYLDIDPPETRVRHRRFVLDILDDIFGINILRPIETIRTENDEYGETEDSAHQSRIASVLPTMPYEDTGDHLLDLAQWLDWVTGVFLAAGNLPDHQSRVKRIFQNY